jgi:hypothetical protein
MQTAPRLERRAYAAALLLAFITGLMKLLPFSMAALWAGVGSPFSLTVWLIAGAWLICTLAPLFLINSQNKRGPVLAMISSSMMLVATGNGLVLLARSQKLYDPLYFSTSSPWVWEGIPFAFNAILLVLAIRQFTSAKRMPHRNLRDRELRSPELLGWRYIVATIFAVVGILFLALLEALFTCSWFHSNLMYLPACITAFAAVLLAASPLLHLRRISTFALNTVASLTSMAMTCLFFVKTLSITQSNNDSGEIFWFFALPAIGLFIFASVSYSKLSALRTSRGISDDQLKTP